MGAAKYTPLLRDGAIIARTLREAYGAARPREGWRREAHGVATTVRAFHPALFEVEVVDVVQETDDTHTLVVEATDGRLPAHLAGQYVNVFVEIDGVRTSRPLSISSRPGAGQLSLTVKRVPDGFVSRHLVDHVQVGHRLQISGPEGDFHHVPFRDGDDLVFIAGGSGVTPFVPMIEQLLARRAEARLHLVYGSVDADQIIFQRRLVNLARGNGALSLTLTVDRAGAGWSGHTGLLNDALLRDALGDDLSGKTFFICGPPAMERAVLTALERLGVSRSSVRVELSGPPADPTTLPGWPQGRSPDDEVTLTLDDERVVARAGEPLLNSLERSGFEVPALCRSGCCGSCRTRVLEGDVIQAGQPRPSDVDASYVNACVSYPVTDASLRLPGKGVQRLPPKKDHPPGPQEEAATAMVAVTGQAVEQPAQGAGKLWFRRGLALSSLALFFFFVGTLAWYATR